MVKNHLTNDELIVHSLYCLKVIKKVAKPKSQTFSEVKKFVLSFFGRPADTFLSGLCFIQMTYPSSRSRFFNKFRPWVLVQHAFRLVFAIRVWKMLFGIRIQKVFGPLPLFGNSGLDAKILDCFDLATEN